jgi:nitrite reductase/ring-hydroxylating ferredoxin subunit
LERGTVVGGVLFCPLHQWGFYLSTGESSHANDLWAPTYRVVSEGERLYLELD